jgi:cytochrome b6-f complex iron-sulfur subunit
MAALGRWLVGFGVRRTLFGIIFGWVAWGLIGLVGRRGQGALAVRPDRRQFLRNAALGAVGSVTALLTAGFGLLLWPNKTGAFGSELTLRAEDVPAVKAPPYRSTAGHFFLAHADDGLLAMWWKCPHLGCTVPWVGPVDSPNAFQCPCHGSMYNYEGERTGGPAPRPLDLMAVRVDDATGNVIVDTGEISQRLDYRPEQATPYPA